MIGYKIEQQNDEIILVQIGAILALEFENQAANFYNTDCENIVIWMESKTAWDKVDAPSINVSLAEGIYDNRNTGFVRGTYTYNIDVFTNAKTTQNQRGDRLSSLQAHRIKGICRAILEDPIYKTMGFSPGNVGNVRVTSFEVGNINKVDQDALNTTIERLIVTVQAGESSVLPMANLLTEALTKLKLNLTDNGYQYEFIQP